MTTDTLAAVTSCRVTDDSEWLEMPLLEMKLGRITMGKIGIHKVGFA